MHGRRVVGGAVQVQRPYARDVGTRTPLQGAAGGGRPLSASRGFLLMSTSWVVPFLICLLVTSAVAKAEPVSASTSASSATSIEPDGRRRLSRDMRVLPSVGLMTTLMAMGHNP